MMVSRFLVHLQKGYESLLEKKYTYIPETEHYEHTNIELTVSKNDTKFTVIKLKEEKRCLQTLLRTRGLFKLLPIDPQSGA